jgi:hypothetical protein
MEGNNVNAAKAMAVMLVIFDTEIGSIVDPHLVFDFIQINFINTQSLTFLRDDLVEAVNNSRLRKYVQNICGVEFPYRKLIGHVLTYEMKFLVPLATRRNLIMSAVNDNDANFHNDDSALINALISKFIEITTPPTTTLSSSTSSEPLQVNDVQTDLDRLNSWKSATLKSI